MVDKRGGQERWHPSSQWFETRLWFTELCNNQDHHNGDDDDDYDDYYDRTADWRH